MKKLYVILSVMVILALLTGSSFGADEEKREINPISAGLPGVDKIYDENYNDNAYLTKYGNHYHIDTKLGMTDWIDKQMANVTNILFSLQKSFVEIIIFLYDKSLNFKTYSIFSTIINKTIGSMYKNTFATLSTIFLALLGVFFSIKYLQRRQSEFWGELVKIVLIMAVAIMYFTNPMFFAERLELATNELTGMVLTAKVAEDDSYIEGIRNDNVQEEPVVQVANNLWMQYIHKPWQLLEFGNEEYASLYTNDILTLKPGSDEREEAVEELEEKMDYDTENMVTNRLGFILMYYIPLLINLIILAIICFLIVGLQFIIMFIFLMGVFVFLIALVPSFGTEVIKKWGLAMGGAVATKVFMAFVLMVLLAFNDSIYSIMAEEGWVYALVLQLGIYIVVFIFRDKIMSVFVVLKEAAQNPDSAWKMLKRYGQLDPFNRVENRITGKKRDIYRRNPITRAKDGATSAKNRVTGTGRAMKNYVNDTYVKPVKANSDYINEMGEKERQHLETKTNRAKAEKYLEKKHQYKKGKVDKMPPNQYHRDMKNVDEIERKKRNGENPYSDEQINTVVERRKKAKEYIKERNKRGGRPTEHSESTEIYKTTLEQGKNKKVMETGRIDITSINKHDKRVVKTEEKRNRYYSGGRMAKRKLRGEDKDDKK